jgi:hypothetical protein
MRRQVDDAEVIEGQGVIGVSPKRAPHPNPFPASGARESIAEPVAPRQGEREGPA